MLIRREDKELIHNLSLLGALFGACVCVFLTVHLSNRARQENAEHSEYQQTNAALVKLSSPTAGTESPVVDEDILKQVQEHIQQEQPAEAASPQKSFWVDLPRWGFWGICAGSGVAGAVAGFSTIWLQEILRGELDYQGLIISDDLTMEGASIVAESVSKRAELAMMAGCDMVLICNRREAVISTINELKFTARPGAEARIQSMRGSGDIRFKDLSANASWQQAREIVSQHIA